MFRSAVPPLPQTDSFIAKSVKITRSFFSTSTHSKHASWITQRPSISDSRTSGSFLRPALSLDRGTSEEDSISFTSQYSQLDADPFSASTSVLSATPTAPPFADLPPSVRRSLPIPRERPQSVMSRAENAIRNSFPWISDSDRTPVDEPTRTMRRQLSRVFPRSSDSISRASNIAAVKARAAIHRVTSPFRGARAAKEPIAVEAFAPRLTLYRGPSEGDLSSLSHVLEILLAERGGENPRDSIAPSPTPTMPEWVEPLDVEPYHSHPYLLPVRARSSRLLPIRLSCASGFSTCPDRVQSQHLGSVDFRTAVDMVFDIEDNIFIDHVSTDLPAVPTLEPDIVGSWSESDRDSTPLSTPRSYRRPATPLAFDRLLCCQSEVSQKDWSDSGSTTSTVSVIDYHLNLPRYPLKAGKDGPRSSAKPLPFIPLQLDMTAAYTRNASIESLSRFPSPPGSPSFRERFRTVSGRQPDQTASHYTATA